MTARFVWQQFAGSGDKPTPVPHVFAPLTLRHRTLRSGSTSGPTRRTWPRTGPGDRHVGYYRERALGGAGMIVVEPVPVHARRCSPAATSGSTTTRHPRLPAPHRCLPRGRRRGDDPAAVPRRPARRRRQLVCPELVAVGVAVVPRRRRQPRDERGRDRRARRRLRAGGGAGPAGRLRRGRAVRHVPRPHRSVLDTVVESPHRSLGRLVREPRALLGHAAPPHPRGLRRRLHRRSGRHRSTRSQSPRCPSRRCRRSSPGTTSGRSWTTSPAAPAATSTSTS